jgi:hypothetical protein
MESKLRFERVMPYRLNSVLIQLGRLRDFSEILDYEDKQKIIDAIEEEISYLKSAFKIKKRKRKFKL